MNWKIRKTYYDKWNVEECVQKKIEEKYKDVHHNKEFFLQLPQQIMKEENPVIKKASFEFFQKTIRSKWKDEDFKELKFQVINNINKYYTDLEEDSYFAINNIVIAFYDYEEEKIIRKFISRYITQLKLEDPNQKKHALLILTLALRSINCYMIVEIVLDFLVNTIDEHIFILDILRKSIQNKEYVSVKRIMMLFAISYQFNTIPDALKKSTIAIPLINISIEILKIKNGQDKYILKAKKSATCFINTVAVRNNYQTKGNKELYEFLHDMNNFSRIYNVFLKQLSLRVDYGYNYVNFFLVELLEKYSEQDPVMNCLKRDFKILITNCILPIHKLSSKDEKDFTSRPSCYIGNRYTLFEKNLRSIAATLCMIIIRELNADKRDWLYNFFIDVFKSNQLNSNKEKIKKVYGVLSLMRRISDLDIKYYKEKFEYILNKFVLQELNTNNLILKAQCYCFLETCQVAIISKEHLINALECTIDDLSHENDSIKYVATAAINFFHNKSVCRGVIKNHLFKIIQSIVNLCNMYEIETLNFLFDDIIIEYSNEISNSSPESICLVGDFIYEALSGQHFGIKARNAELEISSLFWNYKTLINSMTFEYPKVEEIYNNIYKTLEYVFKRGKRDYLEYVFQITNILLYYLKYVEKCTLNVLGLILDLPDLSLWQYREQISILINNVILYEKDINLSTEIYEKIDSIIRKYCYGNFIVGLKIIDSLIENYEEMIFDTERLGFLVRSVIGNLDQNMEGMKIGLRILVRCFYYKAVETLYVLITEQEDSDRYFKFLLDKKFEFHFNFFRKRITLRHLWIYFEHIKSLYLTYENNSTAIRIKTM